MLKNVRYYGEAINSTCKIETQDQTGAIQVWR
jgi:hypothetical protein